MNSIASLSGSHLRTYTTIFQHPMSHNLAWLDVQALFRHLGQVDVEVNGNLKLARNQQTLLVHAPRTKDVSAPDELLALRHFLERSELVPSETPVAELAWLLVIDHREARIYRSLAAGAVPQQIRPPVAEDHFRAAPHAKEFSRGQEKPNPTAFFEPVAGVLHGAQQILIFGSGTGMSSEMDQFIAWLKEHRPELAKRIIGAVVVDEHHQTEAQLLAQAREFFAAPRLSAR